MKYKVALGLKNIINIKIVVCPEGQINFNIIDRKPRIKSVAISSNNSKDYFCLPLINSIFSSSLLKRRSNNSIFSL
jgi:hypothetical protein